MSFRAYLRARLAPIIIIICCAAVFAAIFALYGLPAAPVLYAVLLAAVVLIVYSAFDYLALRRRHKQLMIAKSNIKLASGMLHEPRDSIESDYGELLSLAVSEIRAEQERAEFKYSELTDYFTLWAHQIKTPIAAMKLILQGEDTPVSRELGVQLFMTEQYADMVLAYLRMSGSTDYVFGEYMLGDIVHSAVRRYAAMFIRKKLSIELGALDVRVVTDEKWLGFVIGQLLSNAIKYTADGKIFIYTETSENCPVLVIKDTGIGIAPEDLPRIFERSFTGYNGRIDRSASGIGLYLSKKILDKLGYTITAISEPGGGTEMRITLNKRNEAD